MRALHIQADLATPVATNNPFGFIPLDEIIVEAALRHNLKTNGVAHLLSPVNPDLVIPSLTTEDPSDAERAVIEQICSSRRAHRPTKSQRALREAVTLTRIPLARGGSGLDWYWRASFGSCRTQPVRIRSHMYLLNTTFLDWWCMGDEEKIRQLLATVGTIGVFRRRYGSIRGWRVNRANKDCAVWRANAKQLVRSIPYAEVPPDLHLRYLPAVWGLRPPYLHPANQARVALPLIAGSALESQDSLGADVLQWKDLTLRRQNRELILHGQSHRLTPTEAELLAILLQARGQPVWRGTVMQRLWPPSDGSERTTTSSSLDIGARQATALNLNVYIYRLRKLIEDDPRHPKRLITLCGWGFVLQ